MCYGSTAFNVQSPTLYQECENPISKLASKCNLYRYSELDDMSKSAVMDAAGFAHALMRTARGEDGTSEEEDDDFDEDEDEFDGTGYDDDSDMNSRGASALVGHHRTGASAVGLCTLNQVDP
jgi:hypothetical protein